MTHLLNPAVCCCWVFEGFGALADTPIKYYFYEKMSSKTKVKKHFEESLKAGCKISKSFSKADLT